MRQHAFDHAAPQPGGPAERVDKSGLMADFERHAECGEGRCRQSGAPEQRLQAGAAAVVQQRGDAGLRQAGQFRQRMVEQFEIARQQRAQDQAGGQLAGGAQMQHQAAHVVAARVRGDIDGRALARLARDAACAILAQPVAGDHELRQRVREFCDQREPRGGRKVLQHQHRFPDRGEMSVPLDDAIPRKRRELGIGIFDQLERRRGAADFGDRGADRGRQIDAAGDGALHFVIAGRDDVDEIGVDQERGIFEHRQRHRRLVERQRLHDGRGRFRAAGEHFGHGLAHQRRRVVELHQERALGGGTVLFGEIGNQPGPRQRPRCLCPLACRSGPYPTYELPNDHGPAGLRNLKRHRDAVPLQTK